MRLAACTAGTSHGQAVLISDDIPKPDKSHSAGTCMYSPRPSQFCFVQIARPLFLRETKAQSTTYDVFTGAVLSDDRPRDMIWFKNDIFVGDTGETAGENGYYSNSSNS